MKTENEDDYVPFTEEWKKEMSKLPKKVLIDIAAKIGQEKERLADVLEGLGHGRNVD